jgi:hypothetical protein
MVRILFVIEMLYSGDKRRMALGPGPINRFRLGSESTKYAIRMVLDHIILNRRTFGPAFGTGFHVYVRHNLFLRLRLLQGQVNSKVRSPFYQLGESADPLRCASSMDFERAEVVCLHRNPLNSKIQAWVAIR